MQFETQETVFNGITTVIHESLLYLNPSNNFPNPYTGLQGLQVHTLPPSICHLYLFNLLSLLYLLLCISVQRHWPPSRHAPVLGFALFLALLGKISPQKLHSVFTFSLLLSLLTYSNVTFLMWPFLTTLFIIIALTPVLLNLLLMLCFFCMYHKRTTYIHVPQSGV